MPPTPPGIRYSALTPTQHLAPRGLRHRETLLAPSQLFGLIARARLYSPAAIGICPRLAKMLPRYTYVISKFGSAFSAAESASSASSARPRLP